MVHGNQNNAMDDRLNAMDQCYTRSSTDFYNFYAIGLKQKLPAGMSFEVYATNKIMNLDAHYQTFYQLKQPVFGFSIRRLKE